MKNKPSGLTHLGQHIVVDLYGIAPAKLKDIPQIQTKMIEAAVAAGVTIVQEDFRPNQVGGVSATLILSESHFIMHTLPNEGIAMLDLYTCGGHTDPEKGFDVLLEDLQPKYTRYCRYHRGFKDVTLNKVLPLNLEEIESRGFSAESRNGHPEEQRIPPSHAIV